MGEHFQCVRNVRVQNLGHTRQHVYLLWNKSLCRVMLIWFEIWILRYFSRRKGYSEDVFWVSLCGQSVYLFLFFFSFSDFRLPELLSDSDLRTFGQNGRGNGPHRGVLRSTCKEIAARAQTLSMVVYQDQPPTPSSSSSAIFFVFQFWGIKIISKFFFSELDAYLQKKKGHINCFLVFWQIPQHRVAYCCIHYFSSRV